jgi:hypothetical protein
LQAAEADSGRRGPVVLELLGDEVLDVPTGELEEIAITDVITKQTSCLR